MKISGKVHMWAGLRFYKIRFYKIKNPNTRISTHIHYYIHTIVLYRVVLYLVETNLVETKACPYVTWDEKKILVGKKIKIEVLTDFYYIGCGLSNCATKNFLFLKLTE